MFSFLREAPLADGTPGPLSMRRIGACLCFIMSFATAFVAMYFCKVIIAADMDWKLCLLLFIPCIAFLVGGLFLMYFTTSEAIKGFMADAAKLAAEIKKTGN